MLIAIDTTLTTSRHAVLPDRVEHRRDDARRRVADEADGVEPQGAAAVAAVSAGRKRPCSKSKRTIGSASTMSPNIAGMLTASISARPRDTVARIAVAIADRRVTRGPWQHGGGDRDAEESDRQIHQTKRIGQPRDGAGALRRGEQRVDEEVDLRGGKAERSGSHQHQDSSQALVAKIENRPVAESLSRAAAATARRSGRCRRAARRWRSP